MEEMSKRATQDRISALPDCLLHQILSSLDMEEVVKTSVLSKRWQYIWTSVPTLTFTYNNPTKEGMAVFVAWVNRVILHFQNTSCVEKFVLSCPYDCAYVTDFDMWARFVTNKKVKDLNLLFQFPLWGIRNVPNFDYYVKYTLPEDVFCNSSLTNLCVSGCILMSYEGLRSTCLKNLSFDRGILEDDIISKLLSASPMLVYLKINNCCASQLVINSESLRELTIANNYSHSDGEPLLIISAPSLQSFHHLGDINNENYTDHSLISMASLKRAELKMGWTYEYDDDDDDYYCDGDGDGDGDADSDGDADGDADADGHDYTMLGVVYVGVTLFIRLRHIVELEMGFQCIQAMLFLEAKGLRSPLLGLRCLTLKGNINRKDVPGIVTLLKCTPNLEKLLVNRSCMLADYESSLSFPKFKKKVKSYWRCKRWKEEVPLLNLKSVKFLGYKKLGDVDDITDTLIQLLLKNAPLLPKVVINVEGHEMIVTRHLA